MSLLSHVLSALKAYWPWALLALASLYLISNRYQKNLNSVPGPWLNSFSTLPRMWSVYRGDHHLDDLRLHAKYGRIVRLAPNLVSIMDPSEINHLYGISTKFRKSPFYDLVAVYDEEGFVPDPFVIREDKALHSRMKRNGANAYSMSGLVQLEPWIEPVADRMLSILDQHMESGAVCDLGDLVKKYSTDAICALTFGGDFQYLEEGDRFGFFPTLDLFNSYMSIFGHVAWLHPFLLGNPKIAGIFTRSDSSSEAMMRLAKDGLEKLRTRRPQDNEPTTFLAQLALNQSANPKSITNREIVTHAFNNISAGSDTTAIAIRSAIYHLLKHRSSYTRLCDEVRNNLRLPVSFTEANELPFLRAVIREAMRLHPSVGQILGRIVPAGGATIGGHFIKAGAEVGMSPWVLHRDPSVFTDPDAFRPERWILGEGTKSEDDLRVMNRSFLAFGYGTHTCSGRHISIMEITKIIPTLLLKYDLNLAEQGISYRFKNLWFTPQEGLLVNILPRGSR